MKPVYESTRPFGPRQLESPQRSSLRHDASTFVYYDTKNIALQTRNAFDRFILVCLLFGPRRRYREAFVTAVEKPQDVASENVTYVLHAGYAGSVRLNGPMRDVEAGVYYGHLVFFCRVLMNITRITQKRSQESI